MVTTSLGQVSSGTRVSIAGAEPEKTMGKGPKGNKPRSLSDLPQERQDNIKKMAEEEGVSAEKMFEQMQAKRKQRMSSGD